MTNANAHDHHDLDLIAAHAGGEIDARAEALVAACAQCRAEYDLQRQVRQWLAAAPLVTMAEHERAALHHRVNEHIGRSRATRLGLRSRSKRARWLAPGTLLVRLGAAAVGLIVVVGLSGVLGRDVSGRAASTTIGAVPPEAMFAQGDVGDDANAAATTAAAGTDYGASTAELASRNLLGGDASAVREEARALLDEAKTAAAPDRVATPPCVAQVEGFTPLLWAESVLNGEQVVIIVVEGENEPQTFVYTLAGCELVDLGP